MNAASSLSSGGILRIAWHVCCRTVRAVACIGWRTAILATFLSLSAVVFAPQGAGPRPISVLAQKPPFAGRRVISLAAHPQNPGRVIAGTLNAPLPGAVFLSQDYGRTWQELTPPLEDAANASFSAAAFDPVDPAVVWVADAVAGRLWRSDDGGLSWRYLPALREQFGQGGIGALLAEPGLEGTVLWAGTNTAGVWRSDDQGESWRPVNDGLEQPGARIVRALATTPDGRLLAGTHGGVFILPPGSNTWLVPQSPLPADARVLTLATDAAAPDIVFYAGTNNRGVWRSDDGGQTWIEANGPELAADAFISYMATILDLNGQPIVLVGTSESGYRSADRGQSWQRLTLFGEPWTFGADALVAVSGLVYAGTTGQGVLLSADAGLTWQAGAAIRPPLVPVTPTPLPVATPTSPPSPTPLPTAIPTSRPPEKATATPTDTAVPAATSTPTAAAGPLRESPTATLPVSPSPTPSLPAATPALTPTATGEPTESLPGVPLLAGVPVPILWGALLLLLIAVAGVLAWSVIRDTRKQDT